jgi:hypothetical protein
MADFAPDTVKEMVADAQRVGHDGERRIHRAARREEAAAHSARGRRALAFQSFTVPAGETPALSDQKKPPPGSRAAVEPLRGL